MTEEIVKQRLKSKTYWLGLAVLILTYAQANFALISQYVGEHQNAINFVIGFLILFFREITKEPLSKK